MTTIPMYDCQIPKGGRIRWKKRGGEKKNKKIETIISQFFLFDRISIAFVLESRLFWKIRGVKSVIGVKREIGLVTTRSRSLRRKMIIHPLTLRPDTGAPVRAWSDVERTFPLKDGTGFIVRPE